MRAKIFALWILTFILGTALAGYFSSDPVLYLLLGIGILMTSFVVFRLKPLWATLCAIGFLFFAVSLSQFQYLKYMSLNQVNADKTIQQEAVVYDIPTESDYGQQVAILIGDTKYQAYFKPFPKIYFGQKILLKGKVKVFTDERRGNLIKSKVAGELDVSEFKVTGKDTTPLIKVRGYLFSLRNNFNEKLQQLLPKEEAGLASGLIMGEKASIPPDLKRALQVTGTTHIIALSGYNITIILGLFVLLRKKGSRLTNLLVPFFFVSLFVIMTGAAASVIRASIMGFMPLLAKYLGRPANSIMAVLFSAFVMIIFNPFILLYDPGFQLSFAAMIGLIFLTPLFLQHFKVSSISGQILAETFGAQLAVMPIVIYYFGVVSFIAPLTNLLILALVPWAMLVAFLVGFAGMLLVPIGQWIAIPGFFIFKFINSVIYYCGSLPFASSQFKLDPFGMGVYYFVMFDLIFIFRSRKKQLEL